MTEVKLSRLLSDLSESAATLNQESDSINDLIEHFEEKLLQLNIGLEVWATSSIGSETGNVLSSTRRLRRSWSRTP
jgi:hypothetical protein